MSDELTPITREEHFLAKAGGQDVEVPTPITRRETFLQGVIDAIGSGGGGGGGGVLIVVADEPMETPPEWIPVGYTVFETNATYSQFHTAFSSSPIGLSVPGYHQVFQYDDRRQMPAFWGDFGLEEGLYYVGCNYLASTSQYEISEAGLIANTEDGMLYFCVENVV